MKSDEKSTEPYRKGVQPRLVVKLCSDRSAFEARPIKQQTLDMSQVMLALKQGGLHEIIVGTPHMVIVKSGKAEITLSRDGRMLIKRVSNEDEATRVADQLLDIVFRQH